MDAANRMKQDPRDSQGMIAAAESTWIATCRRVGLGGGASVRVAVTPPDPKPEVGNTMRISGTPYKVLNVEPSGRKVKVRMS